MNSKKLPGLDSSGVVLTAEQLNALQYTSAGMHHRNADPGWEARRDAGLGVTCSTKVETSDSGFTSITKSYESALPNKETKDPLWLTHTKPVTGEEPGTTAPVLLDAAAGHLRDRAATYDKPDGERSMSKTVAIFNLHHGTSLTEAQGWHLLQILKDVRLFTGGKYHADSAEDCIAYAALKAEAMAK